MGLVQDEIKSFKYALEGMQIAFKTQTNFKIQLTIGILTIILALLFGFSRGEWIILMFCISLVLGAELGNTVIEHVVDFITEEQHHRAKIIKDLSAGIVLLTSIFVAIVGMFLFIPHIVLYFK
ncbi:diacylglycerol kinase family protein [Candidatus Curtissbacteria bacterium]|nr:diacylglycerol kinase family protein [Candidatus Curtissbacteria bacterium]